MADNVLEFTDVNFQTDVLQSDQPVLVDYWAPWCGPCRQIAPVIDELAGEYAGRVRIGKMNVEENPRTPSTFGIGGIPTLHLFKGGKIVETIVGLRTKHQLTASLDNLL